MKTKILLLFFLLFFSSNAIAAPKAHKYLNHKGISILTTAALIAVGWVMDEGTKVKKTTYDDEYLPSAGSYAGAAMVEAQATDQAQPNTKQIPEHGSYPLEYRIDGQGFASLEAVKAYMTGDYLKHFGQVWGRNRQGLDYYKVDVYLGSEYHGGIGYFDVSFYGVSKNSQDRLGGTLYNRRGVIYYKGNEEIENIQVTGDYKAQRDKAIADMTAALTAAAESDTDKKVLSQAQIDALSQALAQPQTNAKTDTKDNVKDNTKDNAKPKANDVAKPIDVLSFCIWASWFCDDNTKPEQDTQVAIKDNDLNFQILAEKRYVHFNKQCPANPVFEFSIPFGGRASIPFPLDVICRAFAIFKPVLILFAYIKALVIVGRD